MAATCRTSSESRLDRGALRVCRAAWIGSQLSMNRRLLKSCFGMAPKSLEWARPGVSVRHYYPFTYSPQSTPATTLAKPDPKASSSRPLPPPSPPPSSLTPPQLAEHLTYHPLPSPNLVHHVCLETSSSQQYYKDLAMSGPRSRRNLFHNREIQAAAFE